MNPTIFKSIFLSFILLLLSPETLSKPADFYIFLSLSFETSQIESSKPISASLKLVDKPSKLLSYTADDLFKHIKGLEELRDLFILSDLTIYYESERDFGTSDLSLRASFNLTPKPKAFQYNQIMFPVLSYSGYQFQPSPLFVSQPKPIARIKKHIPILRLESSVNKFNPYLHEQIIHTLTITTNMVISNSSIDQLNVSGALTEPLSIKRRQGDQNNHIIVIKSAIFPIQSGSITIPKQVLLGYHGDENSPNAKKPNIQATSKPITLNVQIPPTNKDETLIVARNIVSKTFWQQNDTQSTHFSDPSSPILVYQLTLQDANIANVPDLLYQIPELALEGVRIYPLHTKRSQKVTPTGINATLEKHFYLLKEKSVFSAQIPSVSFSWWNAQSAQFEYLETQAVSLSQFEDLPLNYPAEPASFSQEISNLSKKNTWQDWIKNQSKYYLGLLLLVSLTLFLLLFYAQRKKRQRRLYEAQNGVRTFKSFNHLIQNRQYSLLRHSLIKWFYTYQTWLTNHQSIAQQKPSIQTQCLFEQTLAHIDQKTTLNDMSSSTKQNKKKLKQLFKQLFLSAYPSFESSLKRRTKAFWHAKIKTLKPLYPDL